MMKIKSKMVVYNKNFFKIRKVLNKMDLNLTKKEVTLLKHLLQEETYIVEDMASTADELDKKELEVQISVMKAIIAKLQ